MDVLKKVKKTQKITIACGLDVNHTLAKEMIEIGPNVNIRLITDLKLPLIGAERDREEAFYGPAAKKKDETVVLVSIQDEMIATIAESISFYWQGRSKKYEEIHKAS